MSAAALAFLLTACDSKSPTHPTIPPGSAGTGALEITGPASVAPGQSAQYSLVLRSSDGSTRPVNGVQWNSSNWALLQVSESGLATAAPLHGDATLQAHVTDPTATGPRLATREILVLPDGTFRLVGFIREAGSGGLPVPGARLEARVDADLSAPIVTFATSITEGAYKLYGVPGNAFIHIRKSGYRSTTFPVQLGAHDTRHFDVELDGQRQSVAGSYTMTVEAGGSCGSQSLANDLKRRTYAADIAQDGALLTITLSGAPFDILKGLGNRFRGIATASGAKVELLNYRDFYYPQYAEYPDVMEAMPDGTVLVPTGRADLTWTPAGLSGSLMGSVTLYLRTDVPVGEIPGRMPGHEIDADAAMTPHRFATVGALGAAAIVILALQVRASIAPPFNVLVVTLDTTRADRLSPYGYMNVSLPSLERLASEGVVFDQATSVAPVTLPAHTSLFTGLLPPRHGVRGNVNPPLAGAHTTLAEVLQAHGFRTGAFVGSAVLDPDRGLKQGFERYRGVAAIDQRGPGGRQRRAGDVVDDALQWLDGVGASPFFLWAHLYDAHRPYHPPEPYATMYGHDLYVGEIAYADSQVGRLLEGLERRARLARTLIVVAGNHGESLGERGERDHGVFIYENVLRVPLIIRAPGFTPSRVGSVVRLTDVMPTILDLLRLPAAAGTDGVSVTRLMQGRLQDLDLEAYAESLDPEQLGWSSLRALRAGRYKLIDAPRPELYDLWRDPFETTNIHALRPDLAGMMTARAAALADGGPGTQRDRVAVSLDVRQRVAALGYLGALRAHPSGDRSRFPDPKDMIHLLK